MTSIKFKIGMMFSSKRLGEVCCTLLTIVSVIFCVSAITVPYNPCPRIFSYKVDHNGYYYGELLFPNDRSGNFELEVNVSLVGYYRKAVSLYNFCSRALGT